MRTRYLAAAAVLIGAFACSQEPSGLSELAAGPPTQVLIVGGDGQTGVVGQELANALVVLVTDAKNKPVQGQIINFVVTNGSGRVFAGASITNKNGEARERWTLGTVAGGAQALEARAVDNTTGDALTLPLHGDPIEPCAGVPHALRLDPLGLGEGAGARHDDLPSPASEGLEGGRALRVPDRGAGRPG